MAHSYWIGVLKHSIKKLDLILTVSEFSRRGILEFCERYRLKPPPIIVTYEGTEVLSERLENPKEKKDYVVHLASTLPHKKTQWLIKRWSVLQKEIADLPTLRLIGRAASNFDLTTLRNVEVDEFLSQPDLEAVIAAARALILPSEIEGFGLPALESFYLRTPVAYVKGTAVEEILGTGTPGGFDLNDDVSFASALQAALAMSPHSIESKASELRSRLSWDRCRQLTVAAYDSLLGS